MLFTFPSRYCYTIGHQVVFRLGWWSTLVPTGFHVSGGTLDTPGSDSVFAYGALTLYDRPSQTFRLSMITDIAVRNPEHIATFGLASSDFARHYFRNLG